MAGPAQAAYRLEKRGPHTSVTFVHLACSGATITDGIVGPHAGIEDSADRGTDDRYVDHLYGGDGGSSTNPVTGGADLLDFRPRPTDPASWHRAVDAEPGDPSGRQHSQGIDWLSGGFDRGVLQGDVSDNGPNQGDPLMDWTGAYDPVHPLLGGLRRLKMTSASSARRCRRWSSSSPTPTASARRSTTSARAARPGGGSSG